MGSRATLVLLVWAVASCAGQSQPPAPAGPGAAMSTSGGGPPAAAAADPADAPLPVDPAVKLETLPNGLRYYLRAHKEPQKRASLRLVVNAGSVLETDAELGSAHFVEHMAFNGTRLFDKQQIVDFIEKIGMRFGRHANASTSFDETIYMFDVPTDDPAVLEKALTILQQIAAEVRFDPQEVDRERGVIIEEWRLGRGAALRVMEKILPVLFKGSRYAERLPIGRKEILDRITASQLRAFYQRWYRPDLMAVMVVGDFDRDKVEAVVRRLFSPLRGPTPEPPRTVYPVPDHDDTLVAVGKDRELPATSVGVFYKLPLRPIASARDYRRHVAEAIYHGMMNGRLEELTRSADPPFLFAGSTTQPFVRAKDVFVQIAAVKQDGVKRGLESLTREVERVDRHGFTKGELEREKSELLRQLERAAREKDKVPSGSYADEMGRHFLREETMPGIDHELRLTRQLLPTITLVEMNRMTSEWISERNRVIVVQGSEAAPVPPASELRAVFERVQRETIAAYVDNVSEGPLLSKLPPPGRITRERSIPELEVQEWTLQNGAKVIWKSTDFKNDEVLMTGFSPGGHSLASERDFPSALYSADIVGLSGLANIGPTELRKALAGKVVSVSPFVNELEEGVAGTASPDDLETLLQLVHLLFTAPRRDAQVFAAFRAQLEEQIERRLADPETVFWDKWQVVYYGNHPRRRPPDLTSIKRINLDTALRFYRQRFADTGDFTYVFVGRIDPAVLRTLTTKYLATLPGRARKQRWRDVGARPRGVGKRVEYQGGVEPKATVAINFTGPARWTPAAEHEIESASEALGIRLREVLREDLGGTYSVGVDGDINRRPAQFFEADVRFSCSPDNVAKLMDAVYAEIRQARDKGFAEDYVAKIKAAQRRSREEAVRTNGFWLTRLAGHARYGTDPRQVLDEPKLIDALTGPALKEAARRYFDEKRQMVGILRPAAAAPAAKAAARTHVGGEKIAAEGGAR